MYTVLRGRPLNPEVGGGGGADKNLSGQNIYFQHRSGARTISIHEKHRVALLTPYQKVANSTPGRPPSGEPCASAGYTLHAKHP